MRRIFSLRRIVLMCLIVFGLPLALTVAYAVINPPSTLMMVRFVTGQTVNSNWRPLSDTSQNLKRAVIMSEDGRFCEHNGVDWGALERQIAVLDEGERPRGASTITMQLSKNLFLWHGRSYVRKAFELPLALWLDVILGKPRTFEIYLNVAEWGDGLFGADAAAQHYFGKSAKSLTERQAALLAAALPNPFLRNPAKPSRTMTRHAEIIQRRMRGSDAYLQCLQVSN
ncbi:MAG: monofunctional biosynthetic peptidoglycan transglycosylase [Stappiaceae bacterium]